MHVAAISSFKDGKLCIFENRVTKHTSGSAAHGPESDRTGRSLASALHALLDEVISDGYSTSCPQTTKPSRPPASQSVCIICLPRVESGKHIPFNSRPAERRGRGRGSLMRKCMSVYLRYSLAGSSCTVPTYGAVF